MSSVKMKEFPNFIWTRTLCDCGQPNCCMDFMFELDDGYLSLSISGEVRTYAFYSHRNWFDRQWWKLKAIVKLLFTGNIEMQADIVLDRENRDKFFSVIEECKKEIETQKKEP